MKSMKELSVILHPNFGTVRNVVIKGELGSLRKMCATFSD